MVVQAIAISPPLDAANPDHPERLARLFDAHHVRLYALARRMTTSADAAHEVVQETFLRGARSPDAIPHGPSQEEAWLVRVLVNICRDEWRKHAVRRRHASKVAAADYERGHEAALVARSPVWRARAAPAPPPRPAALVRYDLEGKPIPEIARLPGIHSVTVRWHLSVGRRELARLLGAR